MNWEEMYQKWLLKNDLPFDLRQELTDLQDKSEIEISDRFYRYLEFGTGGVRGELGAGTNRMNIFIVRRVTTALALSIQAQGEAAVKAGVVISYDSRHFSRAFAEETAGTLAYYGISVYLSDRLRPTPELSFLVRQFQASAGVMITASHNPAKYNGYKIYEQHGYQITTQIADQLTEILAAIIDELDLPTLTVKSGKEKERIHEFGVKADQAYLQNLTSVTQNKKLLSENGDKLAIVYTPLHGTGLNLVIKGLAQAGMTNVSVVAEQALPDGDFPTVSSPNPEDPAVFKKAVQLGQEKKAALLLATDPDADRLGVAVLDKTGQYQFLNGNQLGILLLSYLLEQKKQKQENLSNYRVVKTIVTSDLGVKISGKYGVKTISTLTGFKYIGEKITEFENVPGALKPQFLFGYEESYGYLISDYVRDKDAVQAAVLTAEAAVFYQSQEKTLLDALEDIYQEYGFYQEELVSISFEGQEGQNVMGKKIDQFRQHHPVKFMDTAVIRIEDYLVHQAYDLPKNTVEPIQLPLSNVLKFILADGSWFCIRPSGTEPKCKLYFSVNDKSKTAVLRKLAELKKEVIETFGAI